MIVNLTQDDADIRLSCLDGNSTEFVDSLRSGLYIKVTKASSGTGTYYLRYKNSYGKTAHQKIAHQQFLLMNKTTIQPLLISKITMENTQ